MKRILFFILISNFLSAQLPDLLNTNWKITEFDSELRPHQLPPSMPYQQVTTFSSNYPQLNLSFFNVVSGDLTYSSADNFNWFTINNKVCTLADYNGDNGEVNQFFGLLCNFFMNNGNNYYYYIENNGNQKTLVIGNSIFESISFVAENLATKEDELTKSHIVYPNPATDFITIDNLKSDSKLTITDNSGKLVKTLVSKSSKENIDIKSLTSGIYYLSIDGKFAQKIIKK